MIKRFLTGLAVVWIVLNVYHYPTVTLFTLAVLGFPFSLGYLAGSHFPPSKIRKIWEERK